MTKLPTKTTTKSNRNNVILSNKKEERSNETINTVSSAFIQKTYDMISKCDHKVACWSFSGDNFIVKDPIKLAKNYIPRYFDHSNFSSFSRQLNFYGFKKIYNYINDSDELESNHIRFYHKYFCRGRIDLLHKIKRSNINNSRAKVLDKEIESLKNTISDLEKHISTITSNFEAKMIEMQKQMNSSCSCQCHHRHKRRRIITSSSDLRILEPSLPADLPVLDELSIPESKHSNVTRHCSIQSNHSDFQFLLSSLINDKSLSHDKKRLPFPAPESLMQLPELGAVRLLSDLSVKSH